MAQSKVAIVTGAGSGIGQAVALCLLEAGWKVVLAGRRLERLEQVAALGESEAQNLLCVPTDVADAASVANLFACALGRFGRLDLLFNNAGVSPAASLFED